MEAGNPNWLFCRRVMRVTLIFSNDAFMKEPEGKIIREKNKYWLRLWETD